ncbi:type VI secretion system tip protein VgrG [Buttiauxella agrestis]|uniref:VgrG family protein n=1 Tax=Buttiauxella agrestis ATCC 33320 TaxID=1006004 RepID=A0A085G1R1_9ENTR|nr:type VI secretion system tip protein VgrG [Buttiauxella agrestis]KFC77656.1 VgrG family protein [Buttiauxella agrestis ATCC 33320]
MASDGTRFTFTAGRTPADTFAVVNFKLKQSLSSLFSLEITVACNDPAIGFKAILDEFALLTIWQGDVIKRRVRGIVTFCEQGDSGKHQTLYRMTVRPEFWRSSQRQNCRSFQNYDIQYIFAKLLKEMRIRTHDALFRRPHPAREFCVQFMESDYDFIARLAAEEGIFFFEDEYLDDRDQKLTFTDDRCNLRGLGAFPYNPNAASESSTYCINTFCRSAQIRPAKVTTKDYTFTAPNWQAQYQEEGADLSYQRPDYEIFDYPGRFKDEQHGADFAKYQMDGWRNNVDFASGTSNCPQLQPGRWFTLTDHPREDLNSPWQVVSSEISGNQPQAQIGSSGQGTTLTNRFYVIPATQTWRPTPLPKPLVDGPQIGIVTGPAGEEIYCDEHGRVTVKFAWDRYNKSNEESSCWVRVSQAWAGTGFGNIAIPRVGQEVIVDFLNGDPDQPIITGRTYHAANRAPGDLPGTKTQMAIRSQTYKGNGYNELMFDDQTGQELLLMHAQKDMKTVVLNNRDTHVKVDHTETIGHNQQVTVGLGQTVKVGKENAAGHDQKITVAHDRSITVRNDQTLKVIRDRTVNAGRDDNLYVERDRKVTVKGNQEHNTTKDYISLVKGHHSLEVKGDLAQKVAGSLGVDAQGDIVLQSGSKITLRVGSSFVVIHPGGIDITGLKINFNGGGSAGTPVQTLQPTVLSALGDKVDDAATESPQDENADSSGDGGNSEEGDEHGSEDESDQYNIQFHFSDDDDTPYTDMKYVACFSDGTQKEGVIDKNGFTETFNSIQKEDIKIKVLFDIW